MIHQLVGSSLAITSLYWHHLRRLIFNYNWNAWDAPNLQNSRDTKTAAINLRIVYIPLSIVLANEVKKTFIPVIKAFGIKKLSLHVTFMCTLSSLYNILLYGPDRPPSITVLMCDDNNWHFNTKFPVMMQNWMQRLCLRFQIISLWWSIGRQKTVFCSNQYPGVESSIMVWVCVTDVDTCTDWKVWKHMIHILLKQPLMRIFRNLHLLDWCYLVRGRKTLRERFYLPLWKILKSLHFYLNDSKKKQTDAIFVFCLYQEKVYYVVIFFV